MKKTNLNLLEDVLTEMEEPAAWNPGRAWVLLMLGMAKLDVLNVEKKDLDAVVEYLTNNDGGHSEDYYSVWQDIVDHAKAGEL